MSDNTTNFTSIITLYRQAVRNLPFLKYSWVLIATIAILSLTAYFRLNNFDVFLYAIGVIVISFLSFVFSLLLKTKDKFVRFLLYIFITSFVLTMVIATLGFGSFIIWQKPIFYSRWFPEQYYNVNKSQDRIEDSIKTTNFRHSLKSAIIEGYVKNMDGDPIPGAKISFSEYTGTSQTGEDGHFLIELKDYNEDHICIMIKAKGYQDYLPTSIKTNSPKDYLMTK